MASFLKNRPHSLFLATFLLAAVIVPFILPNDYWAGIFALAGIYVILGLGLNIVAGDTGLLDLSYVAFFGIGAYMFAFLRSDHFGIHCHFLAAVPVCALVTMGAGFLLGLTSIRLSGDYLAIVTLGFAQVFKLLLLNLDTPVNITGGVNGIFSFDMIRIFSLKIVSPVHYGVLIWTLALFVFIAARRLQTSRIGRGFNAVRDDELAARAIGIDATMLKLAAFAAGALVAGFAGAVFASFQDSVFPNNFGFQQLVIVYCMVIIGGLGNVYGVVAGAVVLSLLPEVLREYGGLRMMIYGLALVAIMALRPEGLFSAIPGVNRISARPDKDTTGRLKGSLDLYGGLNSEKPASDSSVREQSVPGRTEPEDAQESEQDPCLYGATDRAILTVDGLQLTFGGLVAIDGLDLILHKHEILSIIGPNGAGKSSVFNVLSGIYPCSKGTIRFRDVSITRLKPHRIAGLGIARTFQNLRLFNGMTVLDNVKAARFCRTRAFFGAILFHLNRHRTEEAVTDQKAKAILDLFGKRLTGYRFDQDVSQLSYANRRRVEIARAMATDPEILLLDEPSAGMNPQETNEIAQFIKTLRDTYGYTILVIEHKLGLVKTVSDRVIVMDHGKKICEGSYDYVSAHPDVVDAYVGKRGRHDR